MSHVSELVGAYRRELALPWQHGLSGSERVWMLVYPPELERQVRAALPNFELATTSAGHGWHQVDLSDELGRWLAGHEYADAFFADPSDLTSAIVDELAASAAADVRAHLEAADPDEVVALVGVASLFPYVRASALISAIDSAIRGRLLVLFPGRYDAAQHSFRLLDARDGFNYRARVITPQGES